MTGVGGPAAPHSLGADLEGMREAGALRKDAIGPPSTSLEDWRYVHLVEPGPLDQPMVGTQAISALPSPCGSPAALLLVDGVPIRIPDLQARGITCRTLQQACAQDASLRAPMMERLAQDTDITRAMAWSELRGGCCLAATKVVSEPQEVFLVSSGGRSGCVLQLELQRHSQLHLQLHHLAVGVAASYVVLDLLLAEGAQLRIEEVQYGPKAGASLLLTTATAQLARDATLRWVAVRHGSKLGRARIEVALTAQGANFELQAGADLRANRQWHELTRVHHRVGMTTSRQLIKTIAEGGAIGSFDGVVRIDAGADGSDARQRHQSLLLSQKGRIDSRPQLDVAADEVKAGHGSSIGHLAEDELFYMRARGLSEPDARALLVQGFIGEVEQLLPGSLRQLVRDEAS